MARCCLRGALLLVVLLLACLLSSGLAAAHLRGGGGGGGGTNREGSRPPSSLSLLTPAPGGDGFLVINASTSTSNAFGRVAFSLVPEGGASFSTTAPSRNDPSVTEMVVGFSNQRLVLLGLRLARSAHLNDSVVYARELVAPPVGPLGGVAVDWTRRRAFFAENTGGSVRAVSLDLPGPTALAQLPVFAQLPYRPYGGSLLGDLALDASRDTLYVGLAIRDGNDWPVTAVWSVRTDGSGLGVARNLTRVQSGSINPPVLALGASAPAGSGSPRSLLVLTSQRTSRSFFDLTAFDLPLTPESGNGTVLQLSTATDDPTGLAEDVQGWIYVADRRRGVARLRNNGTALTQGFIRLTADEPLVALGLVQPGESDSRLSRGPGRLLLFAAKLRFYAAPLLPPVNHLTVLAEAQGNSVTGLVMDPGSCRMWYLENGALVTRQANDWLPATRQITPYTYASSNLAINSRNQLYFARNFPTTGEVLRVDGDVSGGNMSVLVSSFGLQADGTAVATDPVGRKLYYLADGMVFRSELDGSHPAVYARTRPATTISSFALDIKQRLIFYSEGNRPGCAIYQAELDPSQGSPPKSVLAYSCPLTQLRRYPPVSLASDPVNRVLYQLECLGGTYPSCSLYATTLRSPSSDSSSTLLASFFTRLPTRIQFDPQHRTLFLSDPTGKTLLRCPLGPAMSSNLTCFDLHLNPHTRLVAIAVDAPRRQLYAIDKPSYTVVRFELAEPDSPQPNLSNSFEVLHQLRDSELPDDYAPQHMQIDPDAGLLYLRTATGIGRGVMHHTAPAPYSPIEPLINDSVVAFATDPLRQRIHWVRTKVTGNNHVSLIELWSAALDGTDARRLADWLTGSPCGAGLPVALHLDPPSPANASVVPPAFWAVWSTSTVCHWNGTAMRRVVAAPNYGRVKSTAYDAGLQRVYFTGTYWQDVPTIFVADVRKPATSVWKQQDAVALDGIAASAAGGELYVAQLASRSISSSQPVVFEFSGNSRGEVLRAIPPAAALIDMQDPDRPVYFVDREGSSVWTARSDGTGQRLTHRPIHAEYVNASAFWVDSALGLFYWTERLQLDTRVAHLEFLDHVETVLLVPLANSKTVLVDDVRGWIYWSDTSQGRVMRARMDGGGVECFWIGEYYKMTQIRLQAVEPVTGDLIVLAFDASVPDVSVKRRSLATGEVSVLLSVRLGIFGTLSGLGAAQLDPRASAGDDGCLRLWLGAAVEANRADQGFIGTACAGQNRVTHLIDLPQVRQVPWTMQLLPDLSDCLPPSGLCRGLHV